MPRTYFDHHMDDLHKLRPVYHIDCSYWQTWPSEPNVCQVYGEDKIKWTVKESKAKDYRNVLVDCIVVTKLVSYDNEQTWQDAEFLSAYDYNSSKTDARGEKLREAILVAKEQARLKRNRMLAKEREQKLKAEAAAAGLTVSEFKKQKKATSTPRVSKQAVEQLKRKVEIGLKLKELHDEVSSIMKKLDSNEIRVIHMAKTEKRINTVLTLLKDWHK